MVGKKVVGVSAGGEHTGLWTEEGELFTFGRWEAGPRGTQDEPVPRLVDALAGLKVIGASAGKHHSAEL